MRSLASLREMARKDCTGSVLVLYRLNRKQTSTYRSPELLNDLSEASRHRRNQRCIDTNTPNSLCATR